LNDSVLRYSTNEKACRTTIDTHFFEYIETAFFNEFDKLNMYSKTESIGMALNASLVQQGIAEEIRAFGHASEELRTVANEFNRNMLKKSERASWGEWALEENLKEVFAGVEVRKVVPEIGKTPDAHLRLDGRVLCIDSKFVLDTYNKYYETPESQKVNREKLLKTFEKDVTIHVDKIKDDYVQPGKGTHRVAYMFIPSNSA
jgi:DNA anti-recombination protein RmuC